jgi:hypothetical protein
MLEYQKTTGKLDPFELEAQDPLKHVGNEESFRKYIADPHLQKRDQDTLVYFRKRENRHCDRLDPE